MRLRIGWAAALVALAAGGSRGDYVSFVVAEPAGRVVHGDSYVLTLSDPGAIAHARALIAHGPSAGDPIVVADIAAGADGFNRDMLAPGQPAWDWHVTGFLEFASYASEGLDGWPTEVASRMSGLPAGTAGRIGFWNYTIVSELPGPPASSGGGGATPTPEPASLVLLALGAAGLLAAGRRLDRARRARSRPPDA